MKTALKCKNDEFFVAPLKHVLSVMDLVNHLESQNYGQYLMKTALKRKSDEFFVTPLKNVLGVMDLVNHSGIPKLWAISHENGPKMQKR
jgi:hypothetical protein